MRKVKKAVVPVAGLGTRFLPATKNIPKEMLTVVDSPTILYVIEEAVNAGVEDIILIQGRGKTSIEDFFDVSYELEDKLLRDGKTQALDRINRIKNLANIISIRQKQALGLGHAVACSKSIVGNEPFAVLLGDEIMVPRPGHKNALQELADCYGETGASSIAIMPVSDADVSKYGIAEVEGAGPYYKVKSLVEKPKASETKSRWALPGRYIFAADIFELLDKTQPGKNGEIQLTDAMAQMLGSSQGPKAKGLDSESKGISAVAVSSARYDAGDPFGFIKANVEISLLQPGLGDQVKNYLKDLVKNI